MKEKYLQMGITEERYTQMMSSFEGDETLIDEAIEYWGVDVVNKGYDVFDFEGTGMLEIQEVGDTDAFNGCDSSAVDAAIQDGVKIIPLEELPDNFDRKYLGWIDTPENRKKIEDYCKCDNYFCNGKSL